MEWTFIILVAAVLFIIGAVAQIVVVVGLPGVWIILAAAAIIEFLIDPLYLSGDGQTFSWWVLGGCAALAIAGDLFEWIAGAFGAKVGGGTKRGMWGALIGGIIGAIALTPLFAFLPVIGTLCGALAGTFIGAMVGEASAEKSPRLRQTLRPATGATIGRALGTFAKLGISLTVWLTLTVAAVVP